MDAKKILKKLRGESDRERVSLYLSKSLLEEFKNACNPVSPSKVMEELMREFTDKAKKKKR